MNLSTYRAFSFVMATFIWLEADVHAEGFASRMFDIDVPTKYELLSFLTLVFARLHGALWEQSQSANAGESNGDGKGQF